MTLMEIRSAVLKQQGKSTDAQVVQENRDRLTAIINEGLIDFTQDLNLRTTETVDIGEERILDIAEDLSQECTKLIGITQGGKAVTYGRGPSTQQVKVEASGEIDVEYRYVPAQLTNDTDVPGIPERLHPALVNYALAKDNTTNDITAQQRAGQFYQLYEAAKLRARRMYGEPEYYRITHKYE